MRRSVSLALSIGLLLATAGGCAASTSFDGGLFRGRGVAFHVGPVPASWVHVSLPGSDLAFRDEAHEASILVNSRCSASDQDAPLIALTEHLIIGTTQRHFTLEQTIPFDGREARHTVLEARLDGVPMNYDIFVMKKDGCVYDLVYVSSPDAPPRRAEWLSFALGFRTASLE